MLSLNDVAFEKHVMRLWVELELLHLRNGAAACFDVYKRQIFVVGGFKKGPLNSVEKLKVDEQGRPIGKWENVSAMTSKRNLCAVSSLVDKLAQSNVYLEKLWCSKIGLY